MKRLIIAPSAHRDLQEIHDYIAKDNIHAANRWIDKLVSRFDVLCSQPGIGRNRDEIRPNYKSMAEGDYVIFYRLRTEDALEIVRVIHGLRDMRKIIFSDKT